MSQGLFSHIYRHNVGMSRLVLYGVSRCPFFSLIRQADIYTVSPPTHTYVNMFGLRWEECALRLPYEISRPFPCWLPFMPPLATPADAIVSIIQPQFSWSWATCYRSIITGHHTAAVCLVCLIGLLDFCGHFTQCQVCPIAYTQRPVELWRRSFKMKLEFTLG